MEIDRLKELTQKMKDKVATPEEELELLELLNKAVEELNLSIQSKEEIIK